MITLRNIAGRKCSAIAYDVHIKWASYVSNIWKSWKDGIAVVATILARVAASENILIDAELSSSFYDKIVFFHRQLC